MDEITNIPFDPRPWGGHVAYRITEPAGLAREHAVADFAFEVPDVPAGMKDHELRAALVEGQGPQEVPSQFYSLSRSGPALAGRVALFVDLTAGESREVRVYYGNQAARPPQYPRDLQVRKGDLGPLHYFLESRFYKIETMPKSGQIWHIWDKLSSNTSWHHYEWDANKARGGDPCHWAPNCWVAYPERVTNGYEAVDPDSFDWHYVFGWDNPHTEIVDGPVFCEIRRKDVVRPHPEHSSPNLRRDPTDKIVAEVVYRFYDGCPWFYQSSDMQTLEDLLVYFIRNSQFVFLDHAFTHTIICPEAAGLKVGDAVEPAVLRLMAHLNVKPFDGVQHSLSNVLPSKLDYTSFFSDRTGDGFAQFQLLERNTNVHSHRPTYYNHMIFLTELHDWSVYYARAFSYTNRRFHPENAVFLPKGERYQEENVCLIYKHENLQRTLDELRVWSRQFRDPVRVEAI
jgi:hypothetical protein